MFIKISTLSRAVAAGALLSSVAFAASAEALLSEFSFLVVEIADDGEESLVERNSVRPGELIHYQISHENLTDEAMAGVVIAAPVPEGVTFTVGAESTSLDASFEVQADLDPALDGLEWSTLPATRLVIDLDGVLQEEPLPETEIVAVRWTLQEPLEAGSTAINTYRVRVQ